MHALLLASLRACLMVMMMCEWCGNIGDRCMKNDRSVNKWRVVWRRKGELILNWVELSWISRIAQIGLELVEELVAVGDEVLWRYAAREEIVDRVAEALLERIGRLVAVGNLRVLAMLHVVGRPQATRRLTRRVLECAMQGHVASWLASICARVPVHVRPERHCPLA